MSEQIKGITVTIGGDTSGLESALKKVNKETNNTQKELSQIEKLLKFDPSNIELLTQKQQVLGKQIRITEEKLQGLKDAQQKADETIKNGGNINQEQYRKLQREIISTEQSLKTLSSSAVTLDKKMQELSSSNDSGNKKLKELKEKSEDASKKVEELGEKSNKASDALKNIANVAGTVTKAVAGIGVSAISGIVVAEASTREYRSDLSKLETNAKQAGLSFEVMKENLKEVSSLTDETDSSIEALSNLMNTGFDEKGINTTLESLSGAIISFPDTLKIESLADGLQETLATGSATGQFSELLERCGMNLDTFNEGLAEAKKNGTEQEYVLEQLAKTGMADVNKAYQEANKNLLTIKEAQFQFNDAMASLGEIAEPVIASVMGFGADIVTQLVQGFQDGGIDGLLEVFSAVLTQIINKIIEYTPMIIEAGTTILTSLIQGISQNISQIVSAVVQIFNTITTTILSMLPEVLQMGITILCELTKGIAQSLPTLIPAIVDCILLIVDTLINNLDMLIDASIQIIIALAQGLIDALPKLIEKIPEILITLTNAIIENAPLILDAALQLIIMLAQGLIECLGELDEAISKIMEWIIDGISNLVGDLKEVGKNIIEGLWNGMKNAKDWLIGKIQELCTNALDAIKNFFGIESPSKVMRDEVGKYMAEGIGVGFNRTMSSVIEDMKSKLDLATGVLSSDLNITNLPEIQGNNIVSENKYVTNHYSNNTEVIRQPYTVVLEVDREEVGRVIVPVFNDENTRLGVSLVDNN